MFLVFTNNVHIFVNSATQKRPNQPNNESDILERPDLLAWVFFEWFSHVLGLVVLHTVNRFLFSIRIWDQIYKIQHGCCQSRCFVCVGLTSFWNTISRRFVSIVRERHWLPRVNRSPLLQIYRQLIRDRFRTSMTAALIRNRLCWLTTAFDSLRFPFYLLERSA